MTDTPKFDPIPRLQQIAATIEESGSIFLANIHHAYAQTDGTYAFPNSREGDMLKQAVRELLAMRKERDDARMLYCEFVAQDHREGYVNHPEQNPQDVAKSMGWD